MFLTEGIKNSLVALGAKEEIIFSSPPKPEMGDLAFACFSVAKELGGNPVELARAWAEKLNHNKPELINEVKAFGPYINFYFNPSALAEKVLGEIRKNKNYGANNIGQGKKVMIEYPSNNTHKEFHIGHLRNVCIGNALVNLYRKSGYKVVVVNYINDFGAHVVKCLWGVMNIKKLSLPAINKVKNKQKWLGELYAVASGYIKDHEAEVRPELDDLQKKLEAREKKIMALFNKTRKWSLDGFKLINKELMVNHQATFFESKIKNKGQKIVDDLLKKGVAKTGEKGAVIVDLTSYGLEIALVRKSTGAGVYLTSDLALAKEKFKKFSVTESINITGTEQDFYFKQLFKILELNGFKNKMTHIGYGLVNLPEGKMSSRAGNVILYEDLRDTVAERLTKEVELRHQDWSKSRKEKVVRILTQAVLKFTMQQHESNKTVIFDLNQALSFEGFSAPYILYVVARINSLLKKAKISIGKNIDFNYLQNIGEKKLILLLSEFYMVVEKALKNYNPSVVTKYCFDVAQSFNEFYNRYPILNETDKDVSRARLELCWATRKVLTEALSLLTIKTTEEM